MSRRTSIRSELDQEFPPETEDVKLNSGKVCSKLFDISVRLPFYQKCTSLSFRSFAYVANSTIPTRARIPYGRNTDCKHFNPTFPIVTEEEDAASPQFY